MNLYDTRLFYITLSAKILDLTSKVDLLYALDLYETANATLKDGLTKPETGLSALRYGSERTDRTPGFSGYQGLYSKYADGIPSSPYERRKYRDTRRELEYCGITETTADGRVDLPIEASDMVSIPTEFDYRKLNLSALKVYIALHAKVRGHRRGNFFRLQCTREELALAAKVSRRKMPEALAQLVEHGLVAIKKSRKVGSEGTTFTLLDPCGSGVTLYHLAAYFQDRMDTLPVYDRYAVCLNVFDTDGVIPESSQARGGTARNVATMCPFCHGKKSFRFHATAEMDSFRCYDCGKAGDSVRLWQLMAYRIDRPDMQASLETIRSVTQRSALNRAAGAATVETGTEGLGEIVC